MYTNSMKLKHSMWKEKMGQGRNQLLYIIKLKKNNIPKAMEHNEDNSKMQVHITKYLSNYYNNRNLESSHIVFSATHI